jgi:uncharacterized repeat protein (TIGR03803 family)
MSGAYLALKRFAPKMLLLAGVLVLAFAAIRPAQAQYTQSVPYTFTGGGDGAAPAAGLISDSKGNLYGTAAYGGDTSGSSCPGQNPPTGCGVIFELSPPSVGGGPWTETVLYTFTGGSDGGVPYAGLTFDSKGNLYGTTSHGGDTSGSNCSGIGGCGVVFELRPPSVGGTPWTETVLCTFTGGSDGGVPYAGLIFDAGGNLYGTTSGGGSSTYGVVFELSPPSGGSSPWNETVLYAFTGVDDGESPLASLIFDSKGNLYGIAFGGKAGYGVAFELTPPSGGSGPWNEAVLYTFHSRSDGAYPYAGLIFDSKGNLYGTTSNGGDTSGSNCKATRGCGVVFELSPPTGGSGMWTETTPYSFTGGSDGGYPDAGLIFDSKGNLYGTTGQGGNLSGSNCSGSSGCGVVFELSPPTGGTGSWTESVLYTFNGGGDGADPSAGLIFDAKGNFYGTAYSGGDMSGSNCSGTGGCGVVFELSPRQAPAVALSPISLNFGNQVLNTTSAVRKVTATNTGSVTLNISSITVSASFGISANTCGAQLAEGKSCKVSVTFAPPKLGEITGTLSFTDDALNSPQTVPLLGTGIDPATLTPSSAVYGKQKMGTSSMPKTFTLANNQSVALTSIAISTTGDFAVSATTCGTSLAAKQKCTTSVTFTPTQTGTRIGQLTVSDSANNSPQTASLRGTGD